MLAPTSGTSAPTGARARAARALLAVAASAAPALAADGGGFVAAPLTSRPNIVYFLTDDQDQVLGGSFPPRAPGGATPMPKTNAKMALAGATATNFFVHTPICNPSRSELLSGRYFHNIKMVGTATPGAAVDWSMHVNETKVNAATFAKTLQEQGGYTVGMFGKYLNVMPKDVPAGFDAWMGNGGGQYIGPAFMTRGLDFLNPPIPDQGNYKFPAENYTTAVVGNVSLAFIRHAVKQQREAGARGAAAQAKPFMAYVAPKACHEPFNPAPWYADHWDPAWPATEPRPEVWNCSKASRAAHHGNIATNPLISDEAATVITDGFKNRWRTLMSVDDVIGAVIDECEALGVLNNTYFLYSSDHGFQLGEFNLLLDKRNVYDWDTRVHLLARGPGIAAGSTWSQPATQVDLAPTFLGIAGLGKTAVMDGKSLLPLLVELAAAEGEAKDAGTDADVDAAAAAAPASVRRHLRAVAPGGSAEYRAGWRSAVFLEHYFVNNNVFCVAGCAGLPLTPSEEYPTHDSNCGDLTPGQNANCYSVSPGQGGANCSSDCYATESTQNNFIALRSMPGSAFGDTLYAEFQTGEQNVADVNFTAVDFVEAYDAAADPWMMRNLANSTPAASLAAMSAELHRWFACAGDACP